MRYLVLADIHANIEALDACLADATTRKHDRTLVLGDLVGYGPDPGTVIERVRALEPFAIVRGNHDKVACGLDSANDFNAIAKSAALWTHDILSSEHRDWLAALPQGPRQVDDLMEICHGSPFDEDAYIFDELDALRALKASVRPLCLFGHTHCPIAFELAEDTLESTAPSPPLAVQFFLIGQSKYLLNPGAVGQPRDGDPRAAYAIVDIDNRRVELFRLKYPVEQTQAKVIQAGLPEVLAQRLAVGR
jgi:diadenosine tetraphosphatase ApaH/serine/threonine PP2A family protein phosphatase